KLSNRDLSTVREEWPHAQIRIHTAHLARVERAVRLRCDRTVIDTFTDQRPGNGVTGSVCLGDCLSPDRTQVSRNLLGHHFFQSQAKQMWCVTTVRPGHHIAAGPRRATRSSMTSRAAVGQSRTQCQISVNVANAVINQRSLALNTQKLALKKLTSASNRSKRIA